MPLLRPCEFAGTQFVGFKRHWTKTTLREGTIFLILMTGALLFGSNLYFSLNQSINDPIVNPLVPIAKDTVLGLAMLAFAVSERERIVSHLVRRPDHWMLGLFVGVVCISAVVSFGFDTDLLSLAKNLVMYALVTYILVGVLAEKVGRRSLVDATILAIYLALIVGVFLAVFSPVKSTDLRAYGTFGNPTSLGFAAIIGFGLVLWRSIDDGRELLSLLPITSALVVGIVSVTAGSLSVPVAAAVLVGLFAVLESVRLRTLAALQAPAVLLLFFVLSFAVSGWLMSLANMPFIGLQRVVDAVTSPHSLLASDSVTVRLDALMDSGSTPASYLRYDSYLLSLWRNFGPPTLLIYVAWVGMLLWQLGKMQRDGRDNAFLALVVTLLVFNPLLQHQFEVFPTNALFATVAALASVKLWHGTGRAAGVLSTASN